MFRDQPLQPFKHFFFSQVQGWSNITLNFAFPGIYPTGKFQPLYPFTWTITSNNVRSISLSAKPSRSRKEGGCGSASKGRGGALCSTATRSGRSRGLQVFSGYRGLSLWDWRKLILCGYTSSQLSQINFAFKTFWALLSCPLRPCEKGPKSILSRNHSC